MLSVASEPGTVGVDEPTSASRCNPYVPLAVWLIAVVTLLCIPFKVISYGYLPPDDALRHAAKAVAQREWGDILVLRDDLKMDHNPGWHWLLSQAQRAGGLDTETLVILSVAGLFLAALLLPIIATDRPEAWIGAILICAVAVPAIPHRVLLGRPLGVSIAVTLAILAMWTKGNSARPNPALLLSTTILLALSAWIHGSWYLFVLVIAAFCLAGHNRSALWLSICWMVGSFLGACLTGHPVSFLVNSIKIAFVCFGDVPLQRMLVSEFMLSGGSVFTVCTVVTLLFWRRVAGTWTNQCLRHPAFILALLGWLLGLRVVRFEADWAAPGLLLWIALELREHVRRLLPSDSLQRLLICLGLCAALFFKATGDENSRWTRALETEYLRIDDSEMAPWLPAKNGILYSADMGVFYQTFFRNPHATWRYILGFEPGFMPPEDLKVYRNIQRNYGAYDSYKPWVQKMRPGDRLVIRSSATTAPNLPELEWNYTARELWVGRTRPAKTTGEPAQQPGNVSKIAENREPAG